MTQRVGLVLEGGGMRGLYTAGVLDCFLDQGITFPYIVGVSAGACNAASYLSQQRGRNLRMNTVYTKDKRYLSMRNLVTKGSIFGMDMLFDIIPNQLDPFDYDAFKAYDGTFLVGATDCLTGEAVYYTLHDLKAQGYLPLQASSSLPLVAKIVDYEGRHLLDGGIADPIPIRRSVADGNTRHVVVLTQHRAFVKEPSSSMPLVRRKYRHYPGICAAMEQRHTVYNDTRAYIRELERTGQAVVLCPQEPVGISRFEKDEGKLKALYQCGYDDAAAQLEAIRALFADD